MAMEGTVVEKLIVEWRADYSKLTQDIDKIKDELKKTQSEAEQTQREFREGGKAAEVFGNGLNSIVGKAARAAAAIFSVHKAVGYLKNSIQLAMDVVESDSLFETTMGRWADSTRKWADAMEHSLGVNAFEVRKNTGMWYTMTKSMGLTEEQALNMSKSLVQLKYDLASFYNIADERAESVIEGMITGITAPAKQIGVVLTDEVAKRELLAEGIIKQGQAVDSTTMMYGRYLALMKQTETAHGDMARTIDSPANQLRVMQSALRSASLEMGMAFLPIIQTVLPWLQYLAAFIKIVANALASLFGVKGRGSRTDSKQAELVTSLGGVSHGVAEGEEGWKKYGNTADVALGKARRGVKDLQAAIMGFDQIHKIEDKTVPAGGGNALAPGGIGGLDLGNLNADIDDVLGGLDQWIDKTTEIDEKVQGFIDALINSPIGAFGQTIFEAFSDIYHDILKPLGLWLMENSEFTVGALEGILLGVLGFKAVGAIAGAGSPVAIATGVIAGLAGAIDGFFREHNRLAKLDDLAGRFGDISISLEQAQDWARDFFYTFESELIDNALTKLATLRQEFKDWKGAFDGIISKVFVASVGYKLTNEDIEDLRKGINQVISEGERIAREATQSIPIVFSNVKLPIELSTALFEGYSTLEEDFIRTGKRLREAFDNAIADGVITEDEYEVIRKLQIEYQAMLRKMADARSDAALEVIWGEDLGIEETPESFKKRQDAANEEAERKKKEARELYIDQLAYINAVPKFSDDEKDRFKELMKEHYDSYKIAIDLKNISFETEHLSKIFEDAVATVSESYDATKIEDLMAKKIRITGKPGEKRKSFAEAFLGFDPSKDSYDYGKMHLSGLFDVSSIPFETQQNLADFYKSLLPSNADLMKLFKAGYKAGETIPEGVAAGLVSIHAVGAASGNTESLLFMLGRKLSESPEAVEMYRKAKKSGEYVNEYYAAGMESGMALPGKVTEETLRLVIKKLEDGTIDFQEALRHLGLDISDSIEQNKHWLSLSATDLAKAIITSFTKNIPSAAPQELLTWLANNETILYDKVAPYLEKGMSLADAVIAAFVDELGEDTEAANAAKQWVKNNAEAITNNLTPFSKAGTTSAQTYWKSFSEYITLNPPKFSVTTKFDGTGSRGGITVRPLASGGLPEIGELFLAREAGPEFVGRMGSRTVVANNDQIVASVEAGVFRAVVAALGGGGMQRDSGNTYVIPVYVGGEKLYEVVFDRAKRESIRAGRPLMEGV